MAHVVFERGHSAGLRQLSRIDACRPNTVLRPRYSLIYVAAIPYYVPASLGGMYYELQGDVVRLESGTVAGAGQRASG